LPSHRGQIGVKNCTTSPTLTVKTKKNTRNLADFGCNLVAGVGFESPFLKYGRNLRLGTLGSISPYFSYSLRKNDSPDRFYSLAHSLRKPEGKRKAQITPQAKRKVILKDDFLSGCGGGI